jgi:hypothetical protein
MATSSSRVNQALARGALEKVSPVAVLEAVGKAELGRHHWDRAVGLSRLEPRAGEYDFRHDYDSQVEKAYDALIALCEALITAYGYRRKGNAGHQLLLAVAEELLAQQYPREATELGVNGDHLRIERNQLKYDRFGVANRRERDQVFHILPPILRALEQATFVSIGQPPPVHVWST